MVGALELRLAFLEHFTAWGHAPIPAFSVKSSKSGLLFNNSGMAPLYNTFCNGIARVSPLCNVQKCVRLGGRHNDYLNIGVSRQHLSLFEMMGGFSFGSYGKFYAIQLVWEFLARLGLDVSKLVVTVHAADLDAIALWKRVLKHERNVLLAYGEQNVWRAGAAGLCGACTEVYYANGSSLWELLNVVFVTHNQCDSGCKGLELDCVDIGIGLERVLAALDGSFDVYLTDELRLISASVWPNRELTAVNRILVDHVRCANAIIADGVLPANTGAGYVLRKLIRRCVNELLIAHQSLCVLSDLNKLCSKPRASNVFSAEVELCLKSINAGITRLGYNYPGLRHYSTFGVSERLARALAPRLFNAAYCGVAVVYYNKRSVFANAALIRANCLILDKTCLACASAGQTGDQGVVVGASFGFIANHELVNGKRVHKALLSVGAVNSTCGVCVIRNAHLSELCARCHSSLHSLVGVVSASFEGVKIVFTKVNYIGFVLDLDCGDVSSLKQLITCVFGKRFELKRLESWYAKRGPKLLKFVSIGAFGLRFVERCCGTHLEASVSCELRCEFKQLSKNKLRVEASLSAVRAIAHLSLLSGKASSGGTAEVEAACARRLPLAIALAQPLCALRINIGLDSNSGDLVGSPFWVCVDSRQNAMRCSALILSVLSNALNRLTTERALLRFASRLDLSYGLIFVKSALLLLALAQQV